MSYLAELQRQLAAAGIPRATAHRILAEFEDHLACDPAAELGSPKVVAERFASELRTPLTRRAAYAAFGALAITAALLAVRAQADTALSTADITGTRGLVVALAGLAIALGGQIALVCGVLAVLPVLRRERAPGGLVIVQRRAGIALLAGAAVSLGQGVQAVAAPAPGWWLALALAAALVSGAGLSFAAVQLRRASGVTHAAPLPWRWPAEVLLPVAIGAVALMTVGSAITEHSLAEGLTRGVLEGLAIAACFFGLGRRLGLRV